MRTRPSVHAVIVATVCSILAANCGGGGSGRTTTPTSPSPPATPTAVVTAQVAPNPLVATLKSASANAATFEIAATVTFQETGGGSGRITSITGALVRNPGSTTTGTLTVDVAIGARASVVQTYTQQFEITAEVERVTWRFSATGVDALGRSFSVPSVEVSVNPPAPVAAPPPPVAAVRLELYSADLQTYLGCWTCSEFTSDSVFNQFGRYGSRFSQTSIWNHFSPYGSQFASTSACNQFATSPPRLVNRATNSYGEVTLNTFRPFAITDQTFLNYLRRIICEL